MHTGAGASPGTREHNIRGASHDHDF
jgi:hypothetical protein